VLRVLASIGKLMTRSGHREWFGFWPELDLNLEFWSSAGGVLRCRQIVEWY
jgi:hypothetical protein